MRGRNACASTTADDIGSEIVNPAARSKAIPSGCAGATSVNPKKNGTETSIETTDIRKSALTVALGSRMFSRR